jgi:quinol monooxygenase YgiN
MSDPGVILVADLHGLAGRAAELEGLLRQLASGSRQEPGCVEFRILSPGEPGAFTLLSGYADEDAVRRHYATDHYLRYRAQVGPLLARPTDVTVHHVSRTVHPRDPNLPDPGRLG